MPTARLFAAVFLLLATCSSSAEDLPWIVVAKDQSGFELASSGKPFLPWGFNYDHDDAGRLLEDYWEAEWTAVEEDFAEMRSLGANVVRVHLQFGRFMEGRDKANARSLNRLAMLLKTAETNRLYLDLTGLGCYHKRDVPEWYDRLDEADRWDAQCRFWAAVAETCAKSPAVFCYDLMNEPVVPGGRRTDGDWLGPPFAGKHFVQFITLDQKDRPRPEIAKAWIDQLVAAIRAVDQRHLITVGLVDWSLDQPGLTSGFVPEKVAEKLDFVAVHLYPESRKLEDAAKRLKGFGIGKPVVVEETFPLNCSPQELIEFIKSSKDSAQGWISFYWGKPLEELRRSRNLQDALLLDWLVLFRKGADGS